LQDDIVKFIFNPPSPPRPEDVKGEGKGKSKEHREVGEGDDIVTIEDRHTRFPKKTECVSYVFQDHKFTHMIDK
jgi:hypothetical protein